MASIVLRLLADPAGLVVLSLRPRRSVEAENLVLRRELALCQERGDQRWATFLRNHARAIVACDCFVAVTATLRLLYVFVVIDHGSRRPVRVAVTARPSAAWTVRHLREKLGRIDQESRFDHAQVATARAEGQCDRRAADRNDSTRVPGLVDTAVGVAPAIDLGVLGEMLLERR